MFNKSLLLVFAIFVTSMPAALAAGDPMQSLFLFQQKMADKGNASAMMKMGVMYERGEGVSQSYENALQMYKKADAAGHADAKAAIKRLTNSKNQSTNNNKRDAQKKNEEHQRALEAEKLQKQREATALKDTQDAAKEKALREKLNKENSAKASKEAREKANIEAKAIKAKAEAKAKAIKDAKVKAKLAKDNKAAEAKALEAKESIAKAKAARVAAEKKRQQSNKPEEGFKSDPCKGKAARLLSICR